MTALPFLPLTSHFHNITNLLCTCGNYSKQRAENGWFVQASSVLVISLPPPSAFLTRTAKCPYLLCSSVGKKELQSAAARQVYLSPKSHLLFSLLYFSFSGLRGNGIHASLLYPFLIAE
ncbi:hypothetical protein BDBG_18037 [Blastomyces gilchristii SLH14081]|uniref:Uncharacterized protein n=2 Tax=Blastomyces TaxID=229219 RepID=A0A179V288_BLAGS|nr:uncharacterized protein BDBG_18037 [Blastomyces gilchristii SLH14081]KMW68618.1 hypothetical protein BDDG_12924 [Blastomyces dermatitidis ATCC 18188]OAT14435.1 hypothetical protein BDBG_18037 [Blastomyces gilchristii SLH14081]